ncbi:Cytochrome P450 [Rhypophila sp. PSN 637]
MGDTAAIIRGPAILTWLVVSLTGLAYIFLKGYQRRASFNRLRRQGLPMPPWNPFLGHLLALSSALAKLPSDTQQPDAFEILCKIHEKEDGESLIYLDLWPFAADQLLVICSPTLAVQACQDHDLARPEILHKFFDSLAGGDNLFTMKGAEWKRLQLELYLATNGHVVDEAEVYASKLREHARQGDLFSLDKMTCWDTMDIIGAIRWHVLDNEFNLFVRWNPARPLVQAYNNWQMNRYISRELDKRYAEWIDEQDTNTVGISSSRSIIDIVLAEHMAQQQQSTKTTRPKELDAAFKKRAMAQIRVFIFSHPEALAKLLQEHDNIFGKTFPASEQLKQNSALINQLPYTTAVIKETLRLFPPGSAFRRGQKDVYLTDLNGTKYPTEGTNMWILHSALQKHEKYWPHALEFTPERWLITDPEGPLYTGRVKGGWRPFEHGPRDCIGQTLAMLDLKVTLVITYTGNSLPTVREFDVQSAYDEWDLLHDKKIRGEIKHANGERAYQIQSGGVHPADGFPCRVRVRTE